MPTITQQPPQPASPELASPDPASAVSEMIDATEVLYRLTVREYEQIAGFLDDDRVELIDGFMVKKIEAYTEPNPDGYASRVDYAPGEHVSVVVDGATIGTVAVADILP